MAPPKLYMIDLCPQVRTVLLTAKALGITLDHRVLDFTDLNQFNEDFFKPNHRYAVPTLVDNGYMIWNSHAIVAYLIGKFGNDDSLYPKNQEERDLVDNRLHFDSTLVSPNIKCIIRNIIKCGVNDVTNDEIDQLNEIYNCLEEFIGNQVWMAGDKITIADLCLIPSVTSADILVPIDKNRFPKTAAWIKRSQELPYYEEANQIGLDNFKNLIKSLHL